MSGGEIDRRTLIGAGLALATPAIARAQSAGGAAQVACPAGLFFGERSAGGVMNFRGIRYGRAERFRAPVAEPRAMAPVRAVGYGPAAPQAGRGAAGDEGIGISEDCLFLNIWTSGKGGGPKPVMVYIHGGAYSGGSGSSRYTTARGSRSAMSLSSPSTTA